VRAHVQENTIARVRRERGLVVIIVYKLAKGALWVLLGLVLTVMMRMGLAEHLVGWSDHLRHQSRAWSVELADLLVKEATYRRLWTLIGALFGDGVLTLVEGWALWHGHWWGPWLVVGVTGSLLPFEVVHLLRAPHLSRFIVLLVNGAIVAYFVRHAVIHHRERTRASRIEPPERRGGEG
jgi:uncharacterized membrane protein (DUF2068 family)